MKLSIILPVRNESQGIVKTLDLIISNISEINHEIHRNELVDILSKHAIMLRAN